MRLGLIALLSICLVTSAHAADTGKEAYRKCKACHSVVAPDGEFLIRGGMVGPNLYGIAGRPAASIQDYRYSSSLTQAGELGLVWDQETFTAFVQDPMRGFLAQVTGDPKARGRMGFKLDDPDQIELIWSYLNQFSQ